MAGISNGLLLFIILIVGLMIFGIATSTIVYYEETEESDELHELNCEELKAFILSEEDPSQHALNHWTVCTAGGWK